LAQTLFGKLRAEAWRQCKEEFTKCVRQVGARLCAGPPVRKMY
jgi:hypothetical protein